MGDRNCFISSMVMPARSLRSGLTLLSRIFFLLSATLLIALSASPHNCFADEPQVSASQDNSERIEVTPPVVEKPNARQPSFPALFGEQWQVALGHIEAGSIRLAHDDLMELNRMRVTHGFEALEAYSVQLLQIAESRLASGDSETAGFLVRKSLLLSPSSPRVLFESAGMIKITGDGTFWGNIFEALKNSLNHPAILLEFLGGIVYPMLWSLTIAFYLTLLLYLIFSVRLTVRVLSSYFPMYLRGILAPLFMATAVILPCFAGPLWAIAVWTGLLLLTHGEKRWICFGSGVLFVLWGALIPIRENLVTWIEDPGVQTMLNVAAGYYSPGDKQEIERFLKRRSEDGVAQYLYGQLLIQLGELEGANEAILRSELLLGDQPWTKAARASIQHLLGNGLHALKLLAEAEERGMRSAAFFFNRSKVEFEMMDTEASKNDYRMATKQDSDLTQRLSEREGLMGDDGNKVLARISLPISRLLSSALFPVGSGGQNYDLLMGKVMARMSPLTVMMLGSIIIIWALSVKKFVSRTRFISCYEGFKHSSLVLCFFRMVPGGSWILSGQMFGALGILATVVLFSMPILFWPKQGAFLLELSNSYYQPYLLAMAAFTLLILLVGWGKEVKE